MNMEVFCDAARGAAFVLGTPEYQLRTVCWMRRERRELYSFWVGAPPDILYDGLTGIGVSQ